MAKHIRAFVACFLLLVPISATADEGRYQLEKSGDGYVRLDTQTGEMSICKQQNDQLVCRLAAEERAAFQDEIERLDAVLEDLQNRIANLEKQDQSEKQKLPSTAEFERTLGFMEQFMRRFMDILEEFDHAPGGDRINEQRT